MPSQPLPYAPPTTNSLSLQLRIILIAIPVQYVQGPLCLPCSPRPPCVPPLMMELNGSHRGSTPSFWPSLNWGPTHPMTWWTIGTLMLTNIFTIYIYFSHTLAGVVTTSFTLSYLLSNPLQPHPIVCVSLWIITKVLTLICQWFSWPYCH